MFIVADQWHASFPEAECNARRIAKHAGEDIAIEDPQGPVVAYVSPAGHVDLTEFGASIDCRNPNHRPVTMRRVDIDAHRQRAFEF